MADIDNTRAICEGAHSPDDANGRAYEACEELVDLENYVQLWRFRHVHTEIGQP